MYAYGQTSGNFPVSYSVYTKPHSGQFIEKFSPDLTTSIFSTVVGSGRGSPDISPTAFLVNDCENIFLSGWGGEINDPYFFSQNNPIIKYIGGHTTGLPVTSDAFQNYTDGSDFYLMVLSKDAKQLLYGTFLGAFNAGPGEHVDGGTSRFDKRGIVYHAICACRDDSQFPTTPGVWSNTNNSPNCNNGVFKFDLASLHAAFTTNTPRFDSPGITRGCFPFDVVFLNRSIGGKLFKWGFGDDSSSRVQMDSVYHQYAKAGIYQVQLFAMDQNTCQQIDVAKGQIQVFAPHFIIPPDTTLCGGDQVRLTAGGAVHYAWTPSYGLNDPTSDSPLASPYTSINYLLKMTDSNTCVEEDTVKVTVIPSIKIDFQAKLIYDCVTPPRVQLTNHTTHAEKFLWDLGDGNFSSEKDLIHSYDTGNYMIHLHAFAGGVCTDSARVKVHITKIFVPNVITPNGDHLNDQFRITSDAPVQLKVYSRWGEPVYKSNVYKNDWDGSDLPSGVYYYEIKINNETDCNGWVQVLK